MLPTTARVCAAQQRYALNSRAYEAMTEAANCMAGDRWEQILRISCGCKRNTGGMHKILWFGWYFMQFFCNIPYEDLRASFGCAWTQIACTAVLTFQMSGLL